MIDTWLEHRKHGKYPDIGGLNDQDALWWKDMRLVTARFNQWVRLLQRNKDGDSDVLGKLTNGKESEQWPDLING